MKKTLLLSTMLLAGFAAALADEPTAAAPDPTLSADDVISIYSDTYGNVDSFNVNPNWGQPTVTTELAFDDNHYISMAGLTYQGHEFTNTDVSDMEFLHVDIFPTTQDYVKLVPIWKNVDANANYTEIAYTISGLTLNEWNSIDIDLANYASDDRGGTNIVWQFKWDGGNGNTFYADNIYFFKSSTDDTEAPVLIIATASKVQGTWATITAYATDNVPGNLTYSIYNGEDLLATATGLAGEETDIKVENLTVSTAYELTVKVADKAGNEAAESSKTITFTTLDADEAINYYGTVEGSNDQGDFVISYTVTYNTDKTLTVTAEIETPELTGLNHQMSFVSGLVEEWVTMTQDGDVWTYTTTGTVEEGTSVEFFFWLPYAGGVFGGDYHITYVAGSENEKPASLRISAEAQNVATESAEIAYTLKGETEGAVVYYKTSDATDWTEATASPIALTGLTENTEYSYVLKAVNGELTSSEVTVDFKTLRTDAVDLVYADYVKAAFKNSYLTGEDASAARTHYYSLPFSVTLYADGTARYEIDLSDCSDIVGLSPQIYWNDFRSLTKGDDNVYYYDFGTQTEGESVAISHYIAYAGGTVDINFSGDYGTWGLTKERPELGEATTLSLSTLPAGKKYVIVGEEVLLNVYATDANGYYLSTSDVQYTCPETATVADGVASLSSIGSAEITATLGDATSSVTLEAVAGEDSKDTASGKSVIILSDGQGSTALLTDNDYSTLYEFDCSSSSEHSFYLDLEDAYYIAAVHIAWEGAYAKKYTVTLTNSQPSAESSSEETSAMKAKATSDTETTFEGELTSENIDGVGNVAESLHSFNTTEQYQYVKVTTSEAYDTSWNIKIREINVYTTTVGPSGIEGVSVEDATAPVEYYNLNGIRVLNPENGLYIRRQGTKTQKVVL